MTPEQARSACTQLMNLQHEKLDELARFLAGSIEAVKFHWDGTIVHGWEKKKLVFQSPFSRSVEFSILQWVDKYGPLMRSKDAAARMVAAGVHSRPGLKKPIKNKIYLNGATGTHGCSTYGKIDKKTGMLKDQNKYAIHGIYKREWALDLVLDHTTTSGTFWTLRKEILDGIETPRDPRLFERVKMLLAVSMICAITTEEDDLLRSLKLNNGLKGATLAQLVDDPLIRYRKGGFAENMVIDTDSYPEIVV